MAIVALRLLRLEVESLVRYASAPEHWIREDRESADSSRYALTIGDFAVFFSWVRTGVLARNLAVHGVRTDVLAPSITEVEEIALAFGFTGGIGDWLVTVLPEFICVTQEVPGEELAAASSGVECWWTY